MRRVEKGVWKTTIHRDLEYYQYVYLVCVNQIWNEAVDPYVSFCHGKWYEGRYY